LFTPGPGTCKYHEWSCVPTSCRSQTQLYVSNLCSVRRSTTPTTGVLGSWILISHPGREGYGALTAAYRNQVNCALFHRYLNSLLFIYIVLFILTSDMWLYTCCLRLKRRNNMEIKCSSEILALIYSTELHPAEW
jgi:hypothetical protein